MDLMNPPQNWISTNGCFFDLQSDGGGGNAGINPNGTEMAATPLLSYPQDILTMDPVWASLKCTPMKEYGFGLWDPPRTLTPTTALGPAITTLSPHSKISNLDPAPVSTPASMSVSKTTPLASSGIAQISPTLEPIQALPTTTKLSSGKDPVIDQSSVEVPDSKTSYHQPNSIDVPQVMVTIGGKPVSTIPSVAISVHDPIDQNADPAVSVEHTAISVDPESIFAGTSSYHIPSLNTGNEQAPKTVAGEALSAALSGAIVLDGNTIEPGQQTTIDGTYVSVGQHYLIIDSKTYAKPSTTSLDDPLSIVGGQSIESGPDGVIVVGGSTIYPGQHTAIGGDSISLASGKVVVNGKTYVLPAPSSSTLSISPSSDPPAVIGGAILKGNDDGGSFLGDSLIAPGQHTEIHGTHVSVGSDYMVIGSSTYNKPSAEATAVLDAYSALASIDPAVTIAKDGAIVMNDSTISVGQQTTVNGVYLSVCSDSLVVGSSTYNKPSAESTAVFDAYSALASINPAVAIANDGAIVISDSIISVGQQTTVNSVYISVGSDSLVVGSSAYKLPAPQSTAVEKAQSALAALAGTGYISINPNRIVIVGDSSLTSGFQTTISGELVSIASDKVVIGVSTYPLSDGPKISNAPNGDAVIGHYTLSKGESTTISGEVVEVNPSNVVIAGTTYPSPQQTSTQALGRIIASMFGYAESPTPGGSRSSIPGADATSRSSVNTAHTSNPIANLSLFTGAQTNSAGERSLKVYMMVLCIHLGAIGFGLW